jgi:hypothetical protein
VEGIVERRRRRGAHHPLHVCSVLRLARVRGKRRSGSVVGAGIRVLRSER